MQASAAATLDGRPVDVDSVGREQAHHGSQAPHPAFRANAGRQGELLGHVDAVDDCGRDLGGSSARAHANRLLRVEARLRTELLHLGAIPALGRHAELTGVRVATDRDRVVRGARLDALEAPDALGLIEDRQPPLHCESVGGTDVDAAGAADAGLLADLDDGGRGEHRKKC